MRPMLPAMAFQTSVQLTGLQTQNRIFASSRGPTSARVCKKVAQVSQAPGCQGHPQIIKTLSGTNVRPPSTADCCDESRLLHARCAATVTRTKHGGYGPAGFYCAVFLSRSYITSTPKTHLSTASFAAVASHQLEAALLLTAALRPVADEPRKSTSGLGRGRRHRRHGTQRQQVSNGPHRCFFRMSSKTPCFAPQHTATSL